MDQVGKTKQLYFFNFVDYAFIFLFLIIYEFEQCQQLKHYKYDLRIITHFSHDMLCKTMLMKICKCKCDSQNVLQKIETLKVKRKLFHFKLPSMNLEFAN